MGPMGSMGSMDMGHLHMASTRHNKVILPNMGIHRNKEDPGHTHLNLATHLLGMDNNKVHMVTHPPGTLLPDISSSMATQVKVLTVVLPLPATHKARAIFLMVVPAMVDLEQVLLFLLKFY